MKKNDKTKKITSMFLNSMMAVGLAFGTIPAVLSTGCGDDSTDDGSTYYHTLAGTTISVFKGKGVTDAQADILIADFETSYSTWGAGLKDRLNKITEIHVTSSGAKVDHNGNILYIRFDADVEGDVRGYLMANFTARIQQKSDVMLALEKQNNLKRQILPQIAKIKAERQA
ncbi:MAG: hypothetical protein FWG13_06480 [Leptospirales bacterium]|nr:hypothetical protein [Leptospirales bacterium]